MNELRSETVPQPLLPPNSQRATGVQPDPNEKPAADQGPSMGDMMREHPPTKPSAPSVVDKPLQQSPRPQGDTEPIDNPFQQSRNRNADDRDRGPLRPYEQDDDIGTYDRMRDADLKQATGLTCDEFRDRIASQTINQVSLDISPPFRPDEIDEDRFLRLKQEFDEKQAIRTWRTVEGRELATGRLRDLAYEHAVIETEYGANEELPISRLSEADLAYISESWGLPKECLLQQVAYTPRSWVQTTMTWKASNLCHKPLYFQEDNLERYGHTAGPVLQPVVSSAHFFANIAVLPYKMGVHAPGECQYALGYYRPGDCAPWIVPPVPISLRGGLTQAATMTGLFWLVP